MQFIVPLEKTVCKHKIYRQEEEKKRECPEIYAQYIVELLWLICNGHGLFPGLSFGMFSMFISTPRNFLLRLAPVLDISSDGSLDFSGFVKGQKSCNLKIDLLADTNIYTPALARICSQSLSAIECNLKLTALKQCEKPDMR